MTPNEIVLVLAPVGFLCLAVALIVYRVKNRRQPQVRTHAPHSPGAGYDQTEIVRSKGAGMADGGR